MKLLISLIVVLSFTACNKSKDEPKESKPTKEAVVEVKKVDDSGNPTEQLELTVLFTNDHHGRYWKDKKGRYGMAARKTLIDRERALTKSSEGVPVKTLLLSGGDINTGTPESDIFNAEPDFKGMNMLGYDAMAVGNHEFDNPLDILLKQKSLANFPFLSSNIFYKKNNELVFKPYIVKEINGYKVVIVGFTTEDTMKITLDANVKDVMFKSPIEIGKKLIPEIKEKINPHIIIAVTHMGHYDNGNYGDKAPGDITLAREVKGINLIVGGHTQQPLKEVVKVGDTYIVQAGEWGKYLGKIGFSLYPNRVVNLRSMELIPVNYKTEVKTAEDQEVLKLLSPYYQQAQEKMLEVIGQSDCFLDGDRKVVRNGSAPIGVLIARAQKVKAKSDMAIVNGGGIRDDLPKGDIQLEDIYKVHPFGNTLVTVKVGQEDIVKILKGSLARFGSPDNGAFPHFAGVSFNFNGERISNIKINGEPLAEGKTYKVTMNNFIAQGKEGYIDIRQYGSYVDTGFSDALALEEYVRTNGVKCSELKPKVKL